MKLGAGGLNPHGISFTSGILVPLFAAACCFLGAGCGEASKALGSLAVQKVEARTAEDSLEVFLTYQEALLGKDAEAVIDLFGKPKGIFERRNGKVWMYARWCVEFDAKGQVARIQRDIAASGSSRNAAATSMALVAKPEGPAPSSPAIKSITKISNGGQPVDLKSLMRPGKITVVDFYADWCGPCQRIAPQLQALANENAEVMLVKIDIVKWGTPVARQYNISSIPNMRVFDRNQKQVGTSTSSLSQIHSFIERAGH